MKILTAAEMQSADTATFSALDLPSRVVMENAGRAIADFALAALFDEVSKGCVVVAGGGNNGGDGYVIARVLLGLGYPVTVLALKPIAELKGDAKANACSWQKFGGETIEILNSQQLSHDAAAKFQQCGLVIDAVFGTGFKGAAKGLAAEMIELLNTARQDHQFAVLAVDIPSGVNATTGEIEGAAVQADTTVALQCLKVGHVLFPGAECCGDTVVSDIGILEKGTEIEAVARELLTVEWVGSTLAAGFKSQGTGHKGTRGHVLVIGGSAGHYGAVKMAARAALRAGSGLVTMLLPESAAQQIAPELTELMCESLPDDGKGNFSGEGLEKLAEILKGKNAVAVGPGMGQLPGCAKVLEATLDFLCKSKVPAVIDADGLNLISASEALAAKIPANSVLTPHPGEMARLLDADSQMVQSSRLETAARASEKFGCTVALKGARSVIADSSGRIAVNPAATDALATAGSGDVLSGVLASFLGRGIDVWEAVCSGVFAHGCAGELLDNLRFGPTGVVAGDIIEAMPAVIEALVANAVAAKTTLRWILPGSLNDQMLASAIERIYAGETAAKP